MKKFLVLAGMAALVGATSASAAFGDTFTVDTAPFLVVGGVILTALGGFWVVGKTLGLASR